MNCNKENKRERTVNFSSMEVRLLVNIVLGYMHIIENKKTDAVMWKTKNEAWEKIALEFNSQSGQVYRNSKVLRLKYDVLKRQLRKKQANNKQELYKTGGGPLIETKLTDFEEKLAQILSLSIDGLPSRSDSDYVEVSPADIEAVEPEETILVEYIADDVCQLTSTSALNTEKHEFDVLPETSSNEIVFNVNKENENVMQLKRKGSEVGDQTPKKFKATPNKQRKDMLFKQYENLAGNRRTLVNLQQQQIENEVKYREVEHNFKMETLQIQRNYIINEEARKVEEHELKIEKLKLEIQNLK